ncbi:ComF family protein [Candidatus Sumerlaeota bacterium]|nr:ComF family protein [Candidatus Sumerlaeota bacterium]
MRTLDVLSQALDFGNALFDLLLAPVCSVCGERVEGRAGLLCDECLESFEPIGRMVCPTCGSRATTRVKNRCRECPPRPVWFESARAAFLYTGFLPETFYMFKYSRHPELGEPLARLMFMTLRDVFNDAFPRPDFLVPVPLHFLRRFQRGFNQSQLLAEEFGRLAGIECRVDLMERVRYTPRQALQPPERRARNVLGAFAVCDPASVRGRRVAVVDDILTSGSTVNECARVLREAGAASVQILAMARA